MTPFCFFVLWLTVHTNLPYGAVEAALADFDGSAVDIVTAYADARGQWVGKLRFHDVIEVVEPPSTTFTLTVGLEGSLASAWKTVTVSD